MHQEKRVGTRRGYIGAETKKRPEDTLERFVMEGWQVGLEPTTFRTTI